MRIVVSEFISLDGVVQAPGGREEDTDGGFRHGGWSMPFFDPEVMGASIDEASKRTDALLYGRRTWQVMAGAWPGRAGDPFADWINAAEKHVVSDTLTEADLTWAPTSLIRGADLSSAVNALRERPCMLHRFPTGVSGQSGIGSRSMRHSSGCSVSARREFQGWNSTVDICTAQITEPSSVTHSSSAVRPQRGK